MPSNARYLQNRMLSCRCRILLGMCMHECCSMLQHVAADGMCGRGFQMPFECKASAELSAFVYF